MASFQDRGGHVTSYFYDGLNRLTKTQFADGSYTQTVYNPDGTVQTSYDALRNATNYGYDDAGRRTSLTDAMNKLTTFGYDNVGNQTSVLDANQHQTQFIYDKLGRKTSTVYPDQTTDTTHYDSLGRVDYKLDQAGVRTDYGYDGDGRLTSVTQYLNFGLANQQALVTQYGYDEVGNRIPQTDANQHTTKYVYDQLGRRTSRSLPAGQSESYSYDAVGNLQQKVDFNGKTTTYGYDSNNRLQSKTPDRSFSAPAVGFTYSATGKRLTMSDVSGAVQSEYRGPHVLGAFGGFVEPELYGIGVDFTPQFAEGKDHWSCFVTEETAKPDDDRFAAAAKRIKNQGGNFLPRPDLGQ